LPPYLEKTFSFVDKAELAVQKDAPSFKRYCLILQTGFLPAKDKTNIEIANVPSYKNKQVILRGEMDRFLPLAYRQAFKNSCPDICNDAALILKKAITGLNR